MKLLKIVFFLFPFFSCVANAQIPTTDVVNLVNNIASQLETIQQWENQLSTAKNQLDNLKHQAEKIDNQYDSLTGKRNLGTISFDDKYTKSFDKDFASTFAGIRNGGLSGLSASGQSAYAANKVYDICENLTGQHLVMCQAKAAMPSQVSAYHQESIANIDDRVNQLKSLMQSINQTEDPKAIAEIQARIQVENASIQNEQSKLSVYKDFLANEQKVREQQMEEMRYSDAIANKKINRSPMSFN